MYRRGYTMDTLNLSPFDAAEYLENDEDMAAYLQAVMLEAGDDSALIASALGDIARARGMSELARKTGLNREGLYKSLSGEGNPSFDTVLKVAHALGLTLSVAAQTATA